MRDLIELEAARKRTRLRQTKGREPELRRMEQAKPAMDLLTNSEEWNLFLQLIEAERLKHVAEVDKWREVLESEQDFDHSRLILVKTQLRCALDRVGLLDLVLKLPKSAIADAEKAKAARAELDALA